jgi:pimeloyl-ACP methyl ester carboxylesterase
MRHGMALVLALTMATASLLATSDASASHLPNKTVVLLGGSGASLGETPWMLLRQQFALRQFPESNVIEFQYAGGGFAPDGAWNPAPGGKCESFSRGSFPLLRQLMVDLKQARPDHEIFLVGFGVGGFVATQALLLAASGTDDPAVWENLGGIASISGPMAGLGRQRAVAQYAVAGTLGCFDNSMVTWMEEVGSQPDRYAALEAKAEQVMQLGYKIGSFGNTVDCAYHYVSEAICPRVRELLGEQVVLARQFVSDERPTQFIKNGTIFREYNIVRPVEGELIDNHTAVLVSTEPMAELSDFVLSQTR